MLKELMPHTCNAFCNQNKFVMYRMIVEAILQILSQSLSQKSLCHISAKKIEEWLA